MPDLQAGIYWDSGQTPPRHFAVAFLRVIQGTTAAKVGETLVALADLWNGLVRGIVPDLPSVTVPSANLVWLIGYGRKVFGLRGVPHQIPRGLRSPHVTAPILPSRGGPVFAGAGISYSKDLTRNPATEEIAVQFTGDTPLSVSRAVVETWKLLEKLRDPKGNGPALMLAGSFTGFNREDHRSWIGFHDGISNMKAGLERKTAIVVRRSGLHTADYWTVGGSYLTFMRLAVNLRIWEQTSASLQEKLVGRAKVSGCPLHDISPEGIAIPSVGCPVSGTIEVTEGGNQAHQEPPDGVPDELRSSHVQRANHHQSTPARRDSQRFFRQGYEYFEPPIPGRQHLQVGLNFVSFQEHPERLLNTLKRDGWLGGINFGGNPGPELITCYAAGIYFCPAAAEEAFPGASIFRLPVT